MRTFVAPVALVALWFIPCSGCDSNQAKSVVPIVPVKGKITHRGKPLTQGQISFEPMDAGREAFGKIQSDGTFVMSTFKEGDGAVKGVHRVSVTNAGRHVRTKGDTQVEVSEGKDDYQIDLK